MSGGLVQIVGVGAQDIYLTSNPKITFFKVMYRRYTNFAVESIEQTFNGQPNFGKRAQVTVSRTADLVSQMYLRMVLPEVRVENGRGVLPSDLQHVQFAWVKNIGYAAIDEVELEIGGATIDTLYGEWMQIWTQLSTPFGKLPALERMVGNIPELTALSRINCDSDDLVLKRAAQLYIPMMFYFNRNSALALPLIALQFHEVVLKFTFRPVGECYVATEAFDKVKGDLFLRDCSLFVNYVYLDTEERRRFGQSTHEYLIEQLQESDDESIRGVSLKVKLDFNHPVSALYFITKIGNYRGGTFMTYTDRNWKKAEKDLAKKILLSALDLDEFGFFNEPGVATCSDYGVDAIYNAIRPFDADWESKFHPENSTVYNYYQTHLIGILSRQQPLLKLDGPNCCDLRTKVEGIITIKEDCETKKFYPEVSKITRNDLNMWDLSIPVDRFEYDNRNSFIAGFDVIVFDHFNFGLLIDGSINPVTEAELFLNNQSRQSKRSGLWYDTVVPYESYTNTPPVGVNIFSFALHPEDYQPSGTCNFSRIDNASLNLKFAEFGANTCYSDIFINQNNYVNVYATNRNIARVVSGMFGLTYSS